MSLEFEVEMSIELMNASLEVSREDMMAAYEEFAAEYPLLNELANLAMERQDKLVVKRINSHARAMSYSLAGVVTTLLVANPVGIVVTSACLFATLFARADNE